MDRIILCDGNSCTQCMACVNTCPHGCISMHPSEEGFDVPQIDYKNCFGCGACVKSCHVLGCSVSKNEPIKTYACWTKDDSDRRKSSSGGAFSVLARRVLDDGGIVFGAAMDNCLKVKHIGIEKHEDLSLLQGSKYVQSLMGTTFSEVRTQLRSGRLVLFTGTPCQVAGLHAFLHKSFDNLITCDIVCHGVPSQKAFDVFCEKTGLSKSCQGVGFRFTEGWGFRMTRESRTADGHVLKKHPLTPRKAWYLRAFTKGLLTNESCYSCKYATSSRVGDFTIADYWGLGTEIPFNHPTAKGVSLMLVNTAKGVDLIESCPSLYKEERPLSEAVNGNYNLLNCTGRPAGRDTIYHDMQVMGESALMSKYSLRASLRDYLRLVKQMFKR